MEKPRHNQVTCWNPVLRVHNCFRNFTWDCRYRCSPESFRCGSLLQSCAPNSSRLCWWWPLCKCSNNPADPASTTGWAGLMWWSRMRLHLERIWCHRWLWPLPSGNMWSTVQPFLLMPNSLKPYKETEGQDSSVYSFNMFHSGCNITFQSKMLH